MYIDIEKHLRMRRYRLNHDDRDAHLYALECVDTWLHTLLLLHTEFFPIFSAGAINRTTSLSRLYGYGWPRKMGNGCGKFFSLFFFILARLPSVLCLCCNFIKTRTRIRMRIRIQRSKHFTFIEALHDAGMTQKRKRFIAVSIKIHTWGDFLFKTCTQKTS